MSYTEYFTTGDLVVYLSLDHGTTIDLAALEAVLATTRDAGDWSSVIVSTDERAHAPGYRITQRTGSTGGLLEDASTPVIAALDDCDLTSRLVLEPSSSAAGRGGEDLIDVCTGEDLSVEEPDGWTEASDVELAQQYLDAARS